MLIKVCGMRSPQQVQEIEELADYIGFIFYEGSKRFVERTPTVHRSKKVGVFVNASIKEVHHAIEQHSLNTVQLHGDETPEFCGEIRRDIEVIKAFGVDPDFSFGKTKPFEDVVDFFLFDTRTSSYGGSGKQFDWSLLSNYRGEIPFLLSGGINPRSLTSIQALRHPKMIGIDLNSGFERASADKDIEGLSAFIHQLKHTP